MCDWLCSRGMLLDMSVDHVLEPIDGLLSTIKLSDAFDYPLESIGDDSVDFWLFNANSQVLEAFIPMDYLLLSTGYRLLIWDLSSEASDDNIGVEVNNLFGKLCVISLKMIVLH